MKKANQTPATTSSRPMDYLGDDVASGFFKAREHEAYYRSLQLVEDRRAFHAQLRESLLALLTLTDEDGLSVLEDMITRVSRDARAEAAEASPANPVERARQIEPLGVRLLELEAGLDLGALRAAYRAAALRNHPDHGGSNERMTAVNRAYEQLHRILIEEGDLERNWASAEMVSAYGYLWAVRRLLFDVALDEWALDEAATWLDAISSDEERCHASQGQNLIDLIVPTCKLTERLCAACNVARARASLAVAQEGLRLARALGLDYNWYVRQAGETVSGSHKPRFVLNDARQVENAFRLGAIDERRHETNLARLAGRKAQKGADRAKRLSRLKEANFLPSLPIDRGLKPSAIATGLVPYPGYFEWRAEKLTPDQQAQYLTTFSGGVDLDLVTKYGFVRLSSLLRSAVFFTHQCQLSSLLAEAQALAELEPRCSWAAKGVSDVLGYISALMGSQRADYAAQLADLLEPRPRHAGFILVFTLDSPVDLTPTFFDSARQLAAKYSRGQVSNSRGAHD